MNNVNGLPPFKRFCATIGNLPSSYVDSMSYYECLMWLCKYVEEAYDKNVEDLEEFINKYLNNLDYQTIVNQKLDEMASDGTLTQLIKGYVDPYIIQQNAQITNIGNTVNTQLTNQTNDINILKSRMDTFSSLTEGSTTGDAELTDIRVGYNGIKYANAGDAVRTQISNLFNDIIIDTEETAVVNPTERTKNAYQWNGTSVITGDYGYKYAPIDVTVGEVYHIKGTCNYYYPLFIYTDGEGNLIDRVRPDSSSAGNVVLEKTFTCTVDGKLYVNTFPDTTFGSTVFNEVTYILPKDIINDDSTTFNIENLKEDIRTEQIKNDFAWKDMDKVYVTFILDDCYRDISAFQTMFDNKEVPLCYACPPTQLSVTCESGETVKQVLQRCINHGGEVLNHGFNPLTSSSTDQDYIDKLINSKKILFNNGFTDVNGMITIGGDGVNTANFEKCVYLMRPYYKYSDYYGKDTGVIQYYHPRNALSANTTGNRTSIQSAITDLNNTGKGSWVVVYCHGTVDLVSGGSASSASDITQAVSNLEDLVDWVLEQNTCEIVTYKEVYDKFKSSKLEERINSLES